MEGKNSGRREGREPEDGDGAGELAGNGGGELVCKIPAKDELELNARTSRDR